MSKVASQDFYAISNVSIMKALTTLMLIGNDSCLTLCMCHKSHNSNLWSNSMVGYCRSNKDSWLTWWKSIFWYILYMSKCNDAYFCEKTNETQIIVSSCESKEGSKVNHMARWHLMRPVHCLLVISLERLTEKSWTFTHWHEHSIQCW